MPDDQNAALIERMADAYNPDWSARLEGETDKAHAAYLADVRRDMARVLAVVREHEGQALAERLRSEIMTLEHLGSLWVAAADYAALEGRISELEAGLTIWRNAWATGRSEPLVVAKDATAHLIPEKPDAL